MGGGNWSEAPGDILLSIAERLPALTDSFNLAGVCMSWRNSIASLLSPHNRRMAQPPLLMLAESDTENADNTTQTPSPSRGFVGLGEPDSVYKLYLPELHQIQCSGSTGNWLILINLKLEINAFNPFSRSSFSLPSLTTLPNQWDFSKDDDDDDDDDEYDDDDEEEEEEENEEEENLMHTRNCFITKAILSSTPKYDSTTKLVDYNSVVALVLYGSLRKLAMAKPGDESWTPIENETGSFTLCEDIIFFNKQFYAVNCRGKVGVCDINCNPPTSKHISPADFKFGGERKYYLVEWLGELLLVVRYWSWLEKPYYETDYFQVYRFDFDDLKWEEVKNLGQHSLFLGFNRSVALLSSASSSFRRNCIYFTDDNRVVYIGHEIEGGHDMGVFDLEDGTITPHYTGISTSPNFPPIWMIPTSLV